MLLARAPAGTRMSVEKLARELGNLSRNHLHKIIQELTAYGVTVTTRGAGGGVALAVAPESIRLGKFVRHLESDQPVVECFRALSRISRSWSASVPMVARARCCRIAGCGTC
jgi:Rrf2 family nitric oxide-sensitive transcriptional repressor